ncbi:hypothetical protein Droror1_Dr00012834 [Drosera rotundifolia]
MARKKNPPATSRVSIGNCEVLIEGDAKGFTCESNRNRLEVSTTRATKIRVSVCGDKGPGGCDGCDGDDSSYVYCRFLVINPKDADSASEDLLKEVVELYTKELPGMSYAANTGKESNFLERCVSNGKYCTLLLRCHSADNIGKIVAAVTFQIIPADTQYAEIPLAAVGSMHQRKGIGRQLYMDLSRRLRDVGICTILCWADMESEGFWHKQGFLPIAEVDSKGKARRIPIKADIRRALCFPGGSTLMVSHLKSSLHGAPDNTVILPLKSKSDETLLLSANGMPYEECNEESSGALTGNQIPAQPEPNGPPITVSTSASGHISPLKAKNNLATGISDVTSGARNASSAPTYKKNRKRTWESSSSSLKSKRVKASRLADDESYSASAFEVDSETKNSSSDDGCALFSQRAQEADGEERVNVEPTRNDLVTIKSKLNDKALNIMLMDIGDGAKKMQLTKIINDLGGAVTTNGSLATHVLTGKVRRTLNFCTALCGGAWILSPSWLKASFREGRFVDEMPYILEDEEYSSKFRIDLKEAVLRARKSPRSLLKGYNICRPALVLPPTIHSLSTIVLSAGGIVIRGLNEVCNKTRTIFVAFEEDMEEALQAVKTGVQTFSYDWFINCIMKQELDLEAPQFAESL